MRDMWRAGHKDPSFWWLLPVLAKKNTVYQTLVRFISLPHQKSADGAFLGQYG